MEDSMGMIVEIKGRRKGEMGRWNIGRRLFKLINLIIKIVILKSVLNLMIQVKEISIRKHLKELLDQEKFKLVFRIVPKRTN